MADAPFTETVEQLTLRRDLVAQYGELAFVQAIELSGLALCMRALAEADLNAGQRDWLYQQGSLHLAKLLEPLMSPEHSAKVTECSKRIEAANETWVNDEIEKREGLPHG